MHGDVFFAVSSVLLATLMIPTDWDPPPRLLTRDELSAYTGVSGVRGDSPGLYLAILGHVFDVQKGDRHYGVDGGYHGMAGRMR